MAALTQLDNHRECLYRWPIRIQVQTWRRILMNSFQLRRLLSLVLLSCVTLYAQGTSGNISGQIIDPSGLSIPGVRCAAPTLATNVTTSATEPGNYNLIVPLGVYRVTAQGSGFKQFLRNNVT